MSPFAGAVSFGVIGAFVPGDLHHYRTCCGATNIYKFVTASPLIRCVFNTPVRTARAGSLLSACAGRPTELPSPDP